MQTYKIDNFCSKDENIAVKKITETKHEPIHRHDCIEIVYILSGSGNHQVNGASYEVCGGSMLFINYNQTHSFHIKEKMTYFNILIKPEAVSEKIINAENAFEILSLTAFEDLRSADTSCSFMKFDGEERFKIENVINEMEAEFNRKNSGYKAVLKGYLTVLLSYIFRHMLPHADNFDVIPYDITEYISKHFQEKLSLEELSKKCFYSPKYFSHIFKQCYGITVTEYIQKIRIEEGKRLLRETLISVDEISRIIGYDDSVRFYKYFKRQCGITPKQYRKELQKNTHNISN